MFFTPDLLSRRDSGFGLLWLAATLGSKSSFKKIPKRSVLTADISQLCGLIAEPEEPLALRLSSNLMVGVARVYKVKHEIFLADVTTCFNSLKKAISEMNIASDLQLQMGQPSLRPETLTLGVDTTTALALDFATMFMDWDDNPTDNSKDQDDQDFDPTNKTSKRKKKSKPIPPSENIRTNRHILNEDLSHILSNSFDASFSEANLNISGIDLSSQSAAVFGFGDDFFGAHDLDLGGDIGDELARELGEGWGGNNSIDRMNVDQSILFGDDFGMDIGPGEDVFPHIDPVDGGAPADDEGHVSRKRPFSDSDKENREPLLNDPQTNPLSQSRQASIAVPETVVSVEPEREVKKTRKKDKGGTLLLDERTELTADELKDSRAQYMERQNLLRYELVAKRRERDCVLLVEQMLWAIPHDIKAPEIIDFWRLNLKIQMDARMGMITARVQGEPPKKRPRIQEAKTTIIDADVNQDAQGDADMYMDFGNDFGNDENNNLESTRLRSSEEPGQARHNSRPPSSIGSHLNIRPRDVPQESAIIESQKGTLFPWDNAGASSSSGFAFEFAGGTPIGGDDVRIDGRRGSRSPSQREGSVLAASPAQFRARNDRLSHDDFQFQLPPENSAIESQPETSLLTLERNSFNFLEYAKMQLQTLPTNHTLTFDDVVPKTTSTRHVAAAAFYHCLVLGTKHLVGLRQDQPYDNLGIDIK